MDWSRVARLQMAVSSDSMLAYVRLCWFMLVGGMGPANPKAQPAPRNLVGRVVL